MAAQRCGISLALCLLVLVSGCASPSGGISPTETAQNADVSAPEGPPNNVQLARLQDEYPAVNDTGFHYNGSVYADLQSVTDVRFRNVMLCLYDEQWTVIAATRVGTIGPGEQSLSVEIHSTDVPEWVIVEHPEFDNRSVFGGVLRRSGDEYIIAERATLNREPPSRTGACRSATHD